MARCKVTCPRDGEVLVNDSALVIDDDDNVYRFVCPTCGRSVDKPMDDHIRDLLRRVNVPTIDEMCDVFASLLNDDRQLARWLLSEA